VLATAPVGQGIGTTRLGAALVLHTSSDTPAGSYTALLTLTALAAPS